VIQFLNQQIELEFYSLNELLAVMLLQSTKNQVSRKAVVSFEAVLPEFPKHRKKWFLYRIFSNEKLTATTKRKDL